MATLSTDEGPLDSRRRKSMDPVSECIRLEELPNPGSRFVIQELIGIGTSSKVYSALDQQKGTKVAIKIISNVAENLMEIEAEYKALCSVGGESYVPVFYGAFMNCVQEARKELWFVMELCEGVTLSALLQFLKNENKRLKEEEIAVLLKIFLSCLHHIHEKDILHRDIRAANFLLSPSGDVKFIDFGSCAVQKGDKLEVHSSVGAPHWMAPEVITCGQISPYSKSCDVWSLGITAIELAETIPPLHDVHAVRALFQIERNPPPTLRKATRWSDIFKDFIDECLVKNPEHRPCAAELLFHPFIMESDDSVNKVSLEEFLEQRAAPTISEKGKQILKTIGHLVSECKRQVEKIEQPYMTFKNWHFKTGPDSTFVRVLPDDFVCSEHIAEENLLDLLHHRFQKKDVYTFIGDILAFIHPRTVLPLYDIQIQEKYCGKARSDSAPHIFAVADRTYQQMLHHKRSQVVMIFGEFGSGKSATAAHIVDHLAFLGPVGTDKRSFDMAGKIRQICPLLDAFGNVRTLENPNASKHMKVVSVAFTKTGKISGAVMNANLLQNWRFQTTSMSESNYHLFYYVYEGLKFEKRLSDFGLNKLTFLRYLPGKETWSNEELLRGYNTVLAALRSFSFTEDEILSILRTLAAILLLGDVDFNVKDKAIVPVDSKLLDTVAEILKVNKWKLESLLVRAKSLDDARQQRNTLANLLYEGLFEWVLCSSNRKLSFSRLVLGESYAIWVVDAPGPRSSSSLFDLKSNIINDLLHIRMQRQVFLKELEEYKAEKVSIPFQLEDFAIRSQELADREDSHRNLLSLLQKASESGCNWTNELDTFVRSNYCCPEKDAVVIHHASKEIRYKKKDILLKAPAANHNDFVALMKTSADPVIARLWDEMPKGQTWEVFNFLRNIDEICSSEFPHFVICLNPDSPTAAGDKFREERVLQQIRAYNLAEMALIRKQGYARRLHFSDFLQRYKYLAFDFDETVDITQDNCRLLLIRLKMDGWMISTNKVFLKYYTEEFLSQLYEKHVKKIIKVQAMARRFLVKAKQGRT